ncbi:MAG: DsrE family protein, partial [Elusimicrobiota bacterium]|nr:DsrE family protein [Elusimicrobiota bacterium]
EYQRISTDKFNTVKQAEDFMQSGGKIYACGSCIKSREQKDSEMCPLSTMKDMYEITKESDRVVTF